MTRSTDKYLELSEIVDYANKKKADLLVSVHNNASENTDTSGTMTMYAYDTAKQGISSQEKQLPRLFRNIWLRQLREKITVQDKTLLCIL